MIAHDTLTILQQLTGQDIDENGALELFKIVAQQTIDAPAPQAMVASLVETLQLQEQLTGDTKPAYIFSDILARDKHTGYYIHAALRTLYLDFALVQAEHAPKNKPPLLVQGDFLNLSSVNEAVGRSVTNDFMATVCGIYQDVMTRHGVVNWLYHRSMGDEITFIIMNCTQAQVEGALSAAAQEVEELVKAMGIERLRHKKYPQQSGSGLVTASVPLQIDSDHRILKQELDEAIQDKKKQGRTQFFNKLLGVEPEQFHNRASEQRVDKALHKYQHYRRLSALSLEQPGAIEQRSALSPVLALLTGRAIAWPRDDRIEYLRYHHNDTKMMLRADIYNLGGLNSTFGHDGADHVKAQYIRILFDIISTYDVEEPKLFDCGGGIIDVIFNAMSPSVLKQAIESIQTQIYFQVLQHTVADYADSHQLAYAGDGTVLLSDLRHPRYEAEGTGLIMAIHDVEAKRSLPEIIERLDKITHRTKMHGFCYLGYDAPGHVYALLLNQAPEPVPIGTERTDANDHYLPFTDALRAHLRPDDLPVIFEKPIGQICEIVFGTDMQAVLGFKKAIRMLQEKDVNDDFIESIDSYDAMDAALKDRSLPPLSVVSTQNRPSLTVREREAFKTMALAEKLEHLPSALAALLLQTQSVFRSLKILQPHGQLPFSQAQQVLLEEMNTPLSVIDGEDKHDTALTEGLFFLTRLYDRSYACLQRAWPDKLHQDWQNLCQACLHDIQIRLQQNNESFVAKLLNQYLAQQTPPRMTRQDSLQHAATYYTGLVDTMLEQEVLTQEQATQLENRFNDLFKRLHRALILIAPDEKVTVYA